MSIGKVADHYARDQKYDRNCEHEPLSTFTAQPSRCSCEERDQSEEHGEEGVVVSALVKHQRISEAAVGALVCGCGLGRSRRDVFLLTRKWSVKRCSTYLAS